MLMLKMIINMFNGMLFSYNDGFIIRPVNKSDCIIYSNNLFFPLFTFSWTLFQISTLIYRKNTKLTLI